MYLIQPLTYPFYPPYVSTLSPQSLWITAEKVDKSVKKRFSHQEVGKSSEKRGFYISLPKKNVYFALCHTLHHYKTLWIIFALRCVHAVYIIIIFPYCISSATIFPLFYYLLSQLFWFFKCYFLFYIYILWFYILLSLRCFGSTLLYMAVFFPLFFRSFDVETSF